MNDLFAGLEPTVDGLAEASSSVLPGFRLHRLEVLNWGTFDGAVHALTLDGQTTLLVGQNGTGKSTLVDALLTLLVKPGKTRNYNLAAGANKTERTEKSYILGAYDRRSQEEDNRAEVRYLRPGGTTYSVLLACFRNRSSGHVFTLALLLYLSDGGVEKVYCFANDERSIARDCSGLKGMDKLPQEMRKRGFKASTKYTEYFEWFRKATGVQEQAMDMFNQTVAVKDIQRLNDFIRKHMLEARPWGEKVDELFRHFKDLSDAHQELERVRQQRDLLEPIEKHGAAFRQQAEELLLTECLLAAADSYFPTKVIELFMPEIERRQGELDETRAAQQRLKTDIATAQDECYRLKTEIEQAGGERLRQIPLLIETHAAQSAAKRTTYERYLHTLRDAAITESIPDAAAFDQMRARLAPLREELQAAITANDRQRTALIESRVEPVSSLREAEAELQLLTQRQGNLPPEYVEIRRRMCEELRLTERDLPFAAELIAVKPDERSWEASIEMVLRSFGLSLLVPQRHYHLVSRYVDQTRLRDTRGNGQKLVYLLVGERERQVAGPIPESRSLLWKLDFRDGWSPLLPWVKTEVQEHHSFRCCETVEEFQQSHERALNRERHLKHNSARHEKDDRKRVSDPRYFVLGWDNKEKKRRLAEAIESLKRHVSQLDSRIDQLQMEANAVRVRLVAVEAAQRFTSFAEIDFVTHEQEISELRREQKALEENNDTLRMLKQRLAEREQLVAALQDNRDQTLKHEQGLESEIAKAKTWVSHNRQLLSRSQADGSFERHVASFLDLDIAFADRPLTVENLVDRQRDFERERRVEQ
ncbi:MAG: AAA family ATPase, partial [Planctomycetales bacterium]|nr:AAA family ATPase [Planctomycetales bacterium]